MSVRVLVVDDSATMRRLIVSRLTADPCIEVVGEAGDPLQARQAIKALNPDVITLDVEMPHMDGLDFLDRLMRLRPMPVVMVSSLTQSGAEASLLAMELGAVECVGKPGAGADGGFDRLAETVRAAAQVRLARRPGAANNTRPHITFKPDGRVVAIGASTGGVEALTHLLARFPANCPPTVIAQHMPPLFTAGFAERLDRVCAPRVVEASDGARLEPGVVHLAPGGMHLEIAERSAGGWKCRLNRSERVNGHRPSVDVLFSSVARACGAESIGVILTGMGNDGAKGLLEMRQSGADTLGQDEASCVVYGMPASAHRAGAVGTQVPLEDMADAILRAARMLLETEGRTMPVAKSLTVVSVDDQVAMRLLTRNALKTIGIGEVLEAGDGEEALRLILARKQPVHLILSDINMPGIDGIGLLRSVRAYEPISKTPFILLTGWADQEVVSRAMKHGVNSFVAKPFTVTSLKEKIVAVLGQLQ